MANKARILKVFDEDQKDIAEAFDSFITMNKTKNLSKYTIDFHARGFKAFNKFLMDKGTNNTYEVSEKLFSDYVLQLQIRLDNPVSINALVRSNRTFLYHCMQMGWVKPFKIFTLKKDTTIKDTYNEKELKTLLKKPNMKKCLFSEYRTWAMTNFLLATGCRVQTLINVKIRDLNFAEDLIYFRRTKSRKQQTLPMSKTIKQILIEYLNYRKGTEEEYLFCNSAGEQLTRHALSNSIIKYNRSRGCMKTGVHTFRHTFAKMWVMAGGEGFLLQKWLGHSDISVTQIYVNLFSNDLAKDVDSLNPLEQISSSKKQYKLSRKLFKL